LRLTAQGAAEGVSVHSGEFCLHHHDVGTVDLDVDDRVFSESFVFDRAAQFVQHRLDACSPIVIRADHQNFIDWNAHDFTTIVFPYLRTRSG